MAKLIQVGKDTLINLDMLITAEYDEDNGNVTFYFVSSNETTVEMSKSDFTHLMTLLERKTKE